MPLLYSFKVKSDQKFQEFKIRIFPGISGSGFLPEKRVRGLAGGQTLGHFVTRFYYLHKFYKQFGLSEAVGVCEIAKNVLYIG